MTNVVIGPYLRRGLRCGWFYSLGLKFPHIRNINFRYICNVFWCCPHIVRASAILVLSVVNPRMWVRIQPLQYFFFLILIFFKANKLRNNYVITQICFLGPNELNPTWRLQCRWFESNIYNFFSFNVKIFFHIK